MATTSSPDNRSASLAEVNLLTRGVVLYFVLGALDDLVEYAKALAGMFPW